MRRKDEQGVRNMEREAEKKVTTGRIWETRTRQEEKDVHSSKKVVSCWVWHCRIGRRVSRRRRQFLREKGRSTRKRTNAEGDVSGVV